jgi:hypothetical protein
MNILADISAIITALESIIKLVEAIDPNAANNPVVIKIQKILDELNMLKLV